MDDKIEVLNVGQPGKTYRADRAKFAEMRRVMLSVLPAAPPRHHGGSTQRRRAAIAVTVAVCWWRDLWLVGEMRASRPRGARHPDPRQSPGAVVAGGAGPHAILRPDTSDRPSSP